MPSITYNHPLYFKWKVCDTFLWLKPSKWYDFHLDSKWHDTSILTNQELALMRESGMHVLEHMMPPGSKVYLL